jgi:hypothetical protein
MILELPIPLTLLELPVQPFEIDILRSRAECFPELLLRRRGNWLDLEEP